MDDLGHDVCYHGGAFFEFIGDEFPDLRRSAACINADVLDAWFPPAPAVLSALREFLPWIVKTSPPTNCEGMTRVIARHRGVDPASILVGGGSSDLIFLALRHWLDERSRVLILDPTYGEYPHVLERVIGCRVDRLKLLRSNDYRVAPQDLCSLASQGYDLVVLVNPNSPAGSFVPRDAFIEAIAAIPRTTRVWVDETYIEYVGSDQSLEKEAATSHNLIVCKSMSKVYALSGVRAAYLCAHPRTIKDLAAITPPWAVSLPGQIAAVTALGETAYYSRMHAKTHQLRAEMATRLAAIPGLTVVPGVANFLLCHLPDHGPSASDVVDLCRAKGIYLRDAANMGADLGRCALRIAVKNAEENARIVTALITCLEIQERCSSNTPLAHAGLAGSTPVSPPNEATP